MKKLKPLLGLAVAIMLIVGAIFISSTHTAKAQIVVKPQPCGICVTPQNNWPYPDETSSVYGSNCERC